MSPANIDESPSDDRIVLRWTIEPKGYFGDERLIDANAVRFNISEQAIVVKLARSQWTGAFLFGLFDTVSRMTAAVALVRHERGECLVHEMPYRCCPDGSEETVPWPEDFINTVRGGGEIPWFSDHGDPCQFVDPLVRLMPCDALLQFLVDSYQRAIEDSTRELLHLYDIYEALEDRFKGKKLARLGVQRSKLSRLRFLANVAPLTQGRHWGSHHRQLRSATQAELQEARDIARDMVAAYIAYADAQELAPRAE